MADNDTREGLEKVETWLRGKNNGVVCPPGKCVTCDEYLRYESAAQEIRAALDREERLTNVVERVIALLAHWDAEEDRSVKLNDCSCFARNRTELRIALAGPGQKGDSDAQAG